MTRLMLLLLLTMPFCKSAFSQTKENQGWFFLSHKQKLSKRWDGLADVQFRSSDKLIHFQTVLLRGALSYNVSKGSAVAAGYAYKGDWDREDGKSDYQIEHRLYEQYLYNSDIARTELTVRFRLEQRFVKEMEKFNFSQRFRGLLSFQIPIAANADFSEGVYTGVQNELFVNIQHKEKVNNYFFDQNRSYISVGYRWSKKIDTEIGYMYWYQKEKNGTANTNVFQVMITTQL
jgi:hypothetical protein